MMCLFRVALESVACGEVLACGSRCCVVVGVVLIGVVCDRVRMV
jgi:hypothetical protein